MPFPWQRLPLLGCNRGAAALAVGMLLFRAGSLWGVGIWALVSEGCAERNVAWVVALGLLVLRDLPLALCLTARHFAC